MNAKPYSVNQASSSRSSETIADTTRDAVDTVKAKVGEALDRGQAAVSHASDAASHMAETAAQQVSHMAESATQQVKTFASELEAMARRNPLGTLAGALVVGVVVGILAHGRNT